MKRRTSANYQERRVKGYINTELGNQVGELPINTGEDKKKDGALPGER